MGEGAEDAPRRCFVCLADEDLSDPPNSWVDPCPCTIEAHQDCMLSWVAHCEHFDRPLECPVCKSAIKMEKPCDLVVKLSDMISMSFTKTCALIVPRPLSVDVLSSMYMYNAVALWTFPGKNVIMRSIMAPVSLMSPVFELSDVVAMSFIKKRSSMLFTVLSMGVLSSMPVYGAMALWAFSGKDAMLRFVMCPELMVGGRHTKSLVSALRYAANALALLHVAPALLVGHIFPCWTDIFLSPASMYGVVHYVRYGEGSPLLAMAVFPCIRSIYRILYEQLVGSYETKLNHQLLRLLLRQEPANDDNQNQGPGRNAVYNAADVLEFASSGPQMDLSVFEPELLQKEEFHLWVDDAALAPVVPPAAPTPANAEANAPVANHEAHPIAIRLIRYFINVSDMSNAIVNALILPGVVFIAGEALRLVMPKEWTATPPRIPPMRFNSGYGESGGGRPGLFQQQWGRSLVGGYLFVVLRDIMRVYTKARKVTALSSRRVKNVDRPRRLKK